MKLRVLDKIFDFGDESTSSEIIIATIEKELNDTQYVYSHLSVDGVDVYEAPLDFFEDNPIDGSREIVVIVQTTNELLHEILTSSVDYLDRATPHVEKLSKDFYQGAIGDTWNALVQLIEGLQWLLGSYSIVNENPKMSQALDAEEWRRYVENIMKLQEVVAELMGAVESQDQILVADLLEYEIAPLFQDMLVVLEQMVSRGADPIAH